MSNHAFLRVGSESDFARPQGEPSAPVIASCANGIPLLWLAMFSADELKANVRDTDNEDEAFIGCLTPVVTAITRLNTQHQRLSGLFDCSPSFAGHSDMLAEVLKARPEPLVQADFTEVGMMIDAEKFVAELPIFLRWIATGEWDRNYRATHQNLLQKMFAPKPGPTAFVRVNCNLNRKTAIPDANTIRKFSGLSPPDVLTVNYLMGTGWDEDLPWEKD
jgi:hypothetical protein